MIVISGIDVEPFAALSFDRRKRPIGAGFNIQRWFNESPLAAPGRKLLPHRCAMRRVQPGDDGALVPWHTDANLIDTPGRAFTAWIPLVDIDDETPGLEFAGHDHSDSRIAKLWRTIGRDSMGRLALDDDGLRRLIGEYGTTAPRVPVGSALLFSQHEIHRTQIMAHHKPRLSVDIRFAEA